VLLVFWQGLPAKRRDSDIALGGELAVARRHRFPQLEKQAGLKTGKNLARKNREEESGAKASRGAPQTMLQKARLLQKKLGRIARCGSSQGETSHGQRERPRVAHLRRKTGTAVRKGSRDARRRYGSSGRARASDSVAEIDDGRSLLLSVSVTRKGSPAENEMRICDSDEERSAGRMGES